MRVDHLGLELKFAGGGAPVLTDGFVIEGYASLYGMADQGGDVVMPGAYTASLARLATKGDKVRMLWQHDAAQPIGVWDEVREDSKGLWVKGRLLPEVVRAREAAALVAAGAMDGLSIGYRTIRAERDQKGRRLLTEVELWEVSLVTFPMLPEAKLGAPDAQKSGEGDALAMALAAALAALREG